MSKCQSLHLQDSQVVSNSRNDFSIPFENQVEQIILNTSTLELPDASSPESINKLVDLEIGGGFLSESNQETVTYMYVASIEKSGVPVHVGVVANNCRNVPLLIGVSAKFDLNTQKVRL